jgi:hypothetical protein
LLGVRVLEVVNDRLVRLFRVLVGVELLEHVIESFLGLPAGLVVLFLLDFNLVLVNEWEGKRQVFF